MDLDQRFHSNALQSTNREAGYFSNEFDPTVGSPTKRFPTQPSPRSIQSNALPSPRSFYDERGKTTRVETERSAAFGTPIRKEREFEWSDMVNKKHSIVETRYVLVENLPARTRKIDLERLIVVRSSINSSFFTLSLLFSQLHQKNTDDHSIIAKVLTGSQIDSSWSITKFWSTCSHILRYSMHSKSYRDLRDRERIW